MDIAMRLPTLDAALIDRTRREWFGNLRGDVLAGLVVALALIPEAIAFSIIAGVDPRVGLYASFCIAVVISFAGGRPGMISAATAATAVLMVTLVREHGLQYLLAASVLAGLIQIAAGFLKLGDLMRFVSRSVITGFVNALAILIFLAQLPELTNVSWFTYVLVAAGLVIIYGFPFITKAIPSPLVCIIVLTALAIGFGWDNIRTVGDMGDLPDTLPMFLLPNIPLNLDTLLIILPYSAAVAAVGLLESLMTAQIVDDLTDTTSDRNRECVGQGVANTVSGFFGGMAGCAMIGQSVINVKSGGRGRLSCLTAGVLLLFMILVLGDLVAQIPMPALVAIMIMVSVGTFSWSSIRNLRQLERGDGRDGDWRRLHAQSGDRCRGWRPPQRPFLCLADFARLHRFEHALGRWPHAHLQGGRPALLCLVRGLHARLRFPRGGRYRGDRPQRCACLGSVERRRGGHGRPEIPARGCRGEADRYE
jgi:SulP family sulfate permease